MRILFLKIYKIELIGSYISAVRELETTFEIEHTQACKIVDYFSTVGNPSYIENFVIPEKPYKYKRKFFAVKEIVDNGIKEIVVSNKELNLCELLKDCVGMEFYMPHFGIVSLNSIAKSTTVMRFMDSKSNPHIVLKNGQSSTGSEICVFPSKEQRDWSLFVPPVPKWIPKEGERVWVKFQDGNYIEWLAKYFKKMGEKDKFVCYQQSPRSVSYHEECVPFNPIPW